MLFLGIYFEVYCKCFPVECGIPIAIVFRLPFLPLHPHIHCTCACIARMCSPWLLVALEMGLLSYFFPCPLGVLECIVNFICALITDC